jgi:hypothetical protein
MPNASSMIRRMVPWLPKGGSIDQHLVARIIKGTKEKSGPHSNARPPIKPFPES